MIKEGDINVSDYIYCVRRTRGYRITIGKRYIVVNLVGNGFDIVDDKICYSRFLYGVDFFKTKQGMREEQLQKLLDL